MESRLQPGCSEFRLQAGAPYCHPRAVDRVLEAIAADKQRILLTLATGTGKTFIAFQIAWKLFHSRWNLSREPSRRPRILFLADRNILANQAFNAFSAFEDSNPGSLARISPEEIRKKGKVPKNASLFFTIFQTFMASAASTGSATEAVALVAEPVEAEALVTEGSVAGGLEAEPVEAEALVAEPVEAEALVAEPAEATHFYQAPATRVDKPTQQEELEAIVDAPAYMYILKCGDGSFYTGSTIRLDLRMDQHRNGEGAQHTAKHLPIKLMYYEVYDHIAEAFAREKQIQGWSRSKKQALIDGEIPLLRQLAKSKSTPASASSATSASPSVAEPAEAAEAAEGKPAPSPEPAEGYFGEYPPDFFDFIVIDECHRGGANDESNWRGILEYFEPAVQLGLTATPKRKDNIDTYAYFGEPVYIYSLKEGINDGFLTPFRVKQIATTLDEYVYTPDDQLIEGEIETGKRYVEGDFNKIIEIKEREAKRVKIFMDAINQNEKTIVFCATQDHALAVRDLINQMKTSRDPNYCQRVTANDGELGEQHLRAFQDNEKTVPTILTTSQKLSTGVDARNIRNIVLMRPINSMIEFKQIIGRGTRLYDGKDYFTIWDFVKAHLHFSDPEWDGEPIEPKSDGELAEPPPPHGPQKSAEDPEPYAPRQKVKVKLADGKSRSIQHMMMTTFWHPDGTPMSAQQFMEMLFGKLPEFFKNEDELRTLWSAPGTRKKLLEALAEKGFGRDQLAEMQRIIDAEKSDLFDVLAHIAYAVPTETRSLRAERAKAAFDSQFTDKQKEFLEFVLGHYVNEGVEELDQEKLTPLLKLRYRNSIGDAIRDLGPAEEIGRAFSGFQRYLYHRVAR